MNRFYLLILVTSILHATNATSYIRAHIQITPIIIWQGQDIFQHNINAIHAFRKSIGYAPLFHFINPVYFTDDPKHNHIKAASILSAIRSGDQVGIYYNPSICQQIDCNDTLADRDSQAETRNIINHSEKLLQKFGINSSRAIFLENRYFKPSQIGLFEKMGYLDIYGPTNPSLLALRTSNALIANFDETAQYFDAKSDISIPTEINQTKDEGNHATVVQKPPLTIHPINGGIIDINTDEQIFTTFIEQWYQNESSGLEKIFRANLIFHQETAAHFFPRIKLLFRRLYDYAREQRLQVKYKP